MLIDLLQAKVMRFFRNVLSVNAPLFLEFTFIQVFIIRFCIGVSSRSIALDSLSEEKIENKFEFLKMQLLPYRMMSEEIAESENYFASESLNPRL